MRFLDLAATSTAVAATSGRKAKVELLADALRRLEPGEIGPGSAYLAGELRQRQTGVGYASLRERPAPAAEPTLTVAAVDTLIAEISVVAGAGSQARRRELVAALFGAATADEQRLLVGLFSGELRQGAQAGLLADAIAKAAEVPLTAVRRALLLSGDLKQVAVAALGGGAAALAEIHLRVGTPLTPMLAQSAPDVGAALLATGMPATVDVKLDGIRIQVHRSGDDVTVFTRSLDDITARMPEVVEAVRKLPLREAVLDGEAMTLDASGRPRPFQETSSRAATRGTAAARRKSAAAAQSAAPAAQSAATAVQSAAPADSDATAGFDATASSDATAGSDAAVGPEAVGGSGGAARPGDQLALVPFFFDILHLDGVDLIDEPGHVRWQALADALPADLIVGRTTVTSEEEAAAAFAAALAAGQEGVVIKAAEAPYDVGRRGSAWVKVKPRHTLDLVVLAVEWGHGRRKGWLSNLHLGARDPETGGFVMLGKTFKGLTDELLRWQTERFQELATGDDGWVVRVRPVQVVEIAFDGVQTSPRYPGGVALRFARVLRYRDDKPATEADTIDTVRAIGGHATPE
ncbi:ATP-dependent DNA ligase [Paractinoplanes lichenicola]|uniref:DNA ligase (ATP) n=1 Tax=Paractinoplanes lichenicola TaxID=2802976 RepID=A0ABS1W0Z5_9ACTN|nr:ATP-dependent DNA ligase [Actinoplanes lichenicola]MBL7260367.1 ATP-dependent DNA ligase [Actinoplanes lichenicola]